MFTRRQFVTSAGSFAAAAVFAPQVLAEGLTTTRKAPKAHGGAFTDGVMSGDPTPNGMTLWTRLAGVEGPVHTELEIATDPTFRHVVGRQKIATNANLNHAVKARVEKLKPYTQYHYRFSAKTAESVVGRFRTALPADSNQPVNFAYWSCQDYTHGWYNAHQVMADGDYDFVVCLGDYIYAETYHSIADKTGVRDDKIGTPPPPELRSDHIREAITYQDYLDKYELYRTDPHLRAVQQKFPVVMLWDDHEVQDNYAGGDPDGGLPADKRFSPKRKAGAYRAYFNSMPSYVTGERQYRTLSFGKNVDLIIMDQRRYRDNQPCDDAVAPPCSTWDEPRAFLGQTQMKYVQQQLSKSKATWKVMANEVMIMPTEVLGGSFYTFDSWQGYPEEREQLLTYIRDHKIDNVIFATGDIHTFITGDVKTEMGKGDTVAIELVGGSITSQGLGEINLPAGNGVVIPGNDNHPNTSPAVLSALKSANPWVFSADADHHGFGAVKASSDSFDCDLVRMTTIKQKTTARMTNDDTFTLSIKPGQKSLFT